MATIDVKDAAGTTQTLERPLTPGQKTMALSRPVVLPSDQSAIPVSGTVTANAGTGTMTVGGTVAISTLPTTPAGTNNIGDVDIVTMPAITGTVAISTLPTTPAGTNNIGDVDIVTMPPVTNAGTFATQETGGALTSLQLIDDTVAVQGASLSGVKNNLIGASVTTSAPTYINGQISPLSMDTGGNQRVTINPAQLGSLVRNAVPVVTGGFKYKAVAAGATNVVLETSGGLGAIGDYLETLVCVVNTPATSQVRIGDGVTPATEVLPNAVAGAVGTYHIALGILATGGAWRISTGAGVTVLATGNWN